MAQLYLVSEVVTATLYETLLFALPATLELTIIIISWIVSYRLALQRQSRVLLLVSRGFLVKWVIDGAWDAYFYVLLGGPIGIINSLQNQSAQNIGVTYALYAWTGIATYLVSFALMVFFIIKGALVATSGQQALQAVTPPTSSQ